MTLLSRSYNWTRAKIRALIAAGFGQLGPFTPATGVAETLDSILVDTYASAVWEVTLSKSDGTRLVRRVAAVHDGSDAADATAVTWSITGTGYDTAGEITLIDVDLDGAGAAQVMRLRLTLTFGAGTWQVSAWRKPQKPPQYA